MSATETSVARLVDEAAIRDTTARFGAAIMLADFGQFHTLWAEDTEWVIEKAADVRAVGIDQIVSILQNFWDGNDSFVHFAVQGTIEINCDEAIASCMCHELAKGPEGSS